MAGEEKKEVLIPFPEGHEERPFVLAWVERAAMDKITSSSFTFSEAVAGLETKPMSVAERVETTGGLQNEGADTTISF